MNCNQSLRVLKTLRDFVFFLYTRLGKYLFSFFNFRLVENYFAVFVDFHFNRIAVHKFAGEQAV